MTRTRVWMGWVAFAAASVLGGSVQAQYTQNFDSTPVNGLPPGWSTSGAGPGQPWKVVAPSGADVAQSPNNAVYTNDPDGTSTRYLVTPTFISVTAAGPTTLSFWRRYACENSSTAYDGWRIEVSIAGGAWTDIIAAGGAWTQNGYNVAAFSTCCGNVLGGLPGFGLSDLTWKQTIATLPNLADNTQVQFRFLMSSDSSLSSTGVWIDTFEMSNAVLGSLTPLGAGVANPGSIIPGGSTQLRVTVIPATSSNLNNITQVQAEVSTLTGNPSPDYLLLSRIGLTSDWESGLVVSSASLALGQKLAHYTIHDTGATGGDGSGDISVNVVTPSDECQTTTLIANVGMATLTGTTAGMTTSITPTYTLCTTGTLTGSAGGNDLWARFTPPAAAAYTLNLCGSGYDTVLTVYSACPGSDATLVGCNDDSTQNTPCTGTFSLQSRIPSVSLLDTQTYYIRIAGYANATGTYTLNIDYVNPGQIGKCCIGSVCRLSDDNGCNTIGGSDHIASAVCDATACGGGSGTEYCCRGTTCTIAITGSCSGTVANSAATIVVACGGGTHSTISGCCFADYDHSGVSTIDDLFIYINTWLTSSPYCKIDGDGSAIPSIDDLFIFINLWLIGCQP